jgi:aminoglycoside 6-adenylyltransferase
MVKNTDEKAVLEKIIKWAESKADVLAVLLTSSRSKPNVKIEEFSDYDIVFVVEDIKPYLEDESWLDEYGKVLVIYRDPVQPIFGYDKFCYVTQYETGLKIDFTFYPVGLLKHMVSMKELPDYIDDGYKVLLDKHGLTRGMNVPSNNAFVPKPPTEKEYHQFVEEFFSNAPYAAKYIRRGDIFPLKSMLDFMRQEKLGKMLEWKVEAEHNWSLKSGIYGKGLQKYLNPEIIRELEASCAGFKPDDNWEALMKIIKLFSKVAKAVAKRLGYRYPQDMEKRTILYLQKAKSGELP